jgi:hypothetical protein
MPQTRLNFVRNRNLTRMSVDLYTSRKSSMIVLFAALLAAVSMWFYVQRVLIPQEEKDAAERQRPRGNLSDLYPRWLGARELLLHHRNPYGEDISIEIQQGYYGRALDHRRPNDPLDEERFAYPVYVVFLLAPLIGLPFHDVQIVFRILLVVLTAATVWMWLRTLRWRLPLVEVSATVILTLGCFPVVQGIKLWQLSLLVAALLAGTVACVARGFLLCGGVLLALATIKPQLAWPAVLWLALWAAADWRVRRRLVFGFASTMVLLLVGAEVVLPGWWKMFVDAIQQYHRYTQNQSVIEVLVPWGFSGTILAVISLLASAFLLNKLRQKSADAVQFGRATALVMALTVLIVPMSAPYNQILLLPAILVLVRDRTLFLSRSRLRRFGYVAGASALVWPWIASLATDVICMAGFREFAFSVWWWPDVTTFIFPVFVFALMFLDVQSSLSGVTVSREECAS